MVDGIGVIQYGLGPIGTGCARLVCAREGLKLVGAVDVDPAKVGRDVGEVIGLPALGVPVSSCLRDALEGMPASVAVHSTSSSLKTVQSQIEECMACGLNVVSTCEELAYPAAQHPEVGERLNSLACAHGVTVLGTGINPGYAMDALALFLSGVCERVDHVSVHRVVDASKRRLPLQRKIGAGVSVEEFNALVTAGKVRHVGLVESVAMLAAGLGWALNRIDELIEPVVAEHEVRTETQTIPAGRVTGVHQVGRGYIGDNEVIVLDLHMALGAENPGDYVKITGPREVTMTIEGIHGDSATAAVVVNTVPRVVAAGPGLLTMKDIAIPSCRQPYQS